MDLLFSDSYSFRTKSTMKTIFIVPIDAHVHIDAHETNEKADAGRYVSQSQLKKTFSSFKKLSFLLG